MTIAIACKMASVMAMELYVPYNMAGVMTMELFVPYKTNCFKNRMSTADRERSPNFEFAKLVRRVKQIYSDTFAINMPQASSPPTRTTTDDAIRECTI